MRKANFNYASGVIDTGFGDGPFPGAAELGWVNLVAGLLVMVTLFGPDAHPEG